MSRTFKRTNWKGIIGGILVAVLLIAAISVFAVSASADTVEIKASAFSRGGLDSDGNYEETKQTLYTKEAFDCIGLRVVPEFDAQLTYDVYYYDYNGNLIETKLGLSKTYDEDFPLAQTARIVIHPEIPKGVKKSEYKIALHEVLGIANKLKITVDKGQDYKYTVNLYDESKVVEGKTFHESEKAVSEWVTLDTALVEYGYCRTSNTVLINGEYEYFDIFFRFEEKELPPDAYVCAVIADAQGKVCIDEDGKYTVVGFDAPFVNDNNWYKITIKVPEDANADHLRVSMPIDTESIYIFGYND